MKTSRNATAAAAVLVAALVAVSVAAPYTGLQAAREVYLAVPLSAAAQGQLDELSRTGDFAVATQNGRVRITLFNGAIPARLSDWARHHSLPLNDKSSGLVIGSAEAVFSAKDSPAGHTGKLFTSVTAAILESPRPDALLASYTHLVDRPISPPLILPENLAGRSPPSAC